MNHILKYQIDLKDNSFGRVMDKAQAQTRSLDSLVKRAAAGLGGAFAVNRLMDYGQQAVQTSAKVKGMGNAIEFASGSQKEGAANLLYLDQLTQRHGANLMAATSGYKTFLGSMQGVPYTMNQIRKMYEQVDVANTVMNLTAEDSQGVYLALGQIMSKGKVQAEELRGQIGERIPGAFAIAARAMGKTQAELNKMMDDGKLMSVDFLPRFAAELEKTFGSGLEKATTSFQAQSNRRENAILKETVALGTKLQPAYLTLQDIQLKAIQVGSGMISFYDRHNQVINTGVAILATAGSALFIASIRMGTLTATTGMNTVMTLANILGKKALVAAELNAALGAGTLNTAILALNVSMRANPVTWLVSGLAILAVGTKVWRESSEDASKSQVKMSNTLKGTRASMNAELDVLKKVNIKNGERENLIYSINTKYGEYLPKLLTEKATVGEIAAAQEKANRAFEEKIFLMAKEESMAPMLKKVVDTQKALNKSEIDLEKAKQGGKGSNTGDAVFTDVENSKKAIGLNKILLKQMEDNYAAEDKIWTSAANKLGIKSGKPTIAANTNNNQSVSSSKSVRNVMVNIDSLVKQMTNYFQGEGDISRPQNFKKEMTKALIGVVADSETALG